MIKSEIAMPDIQKHRLSHTSTSNILIVAILLQNNYAEDIINILRHKQTKDSYKYDLLELHNIGSL